MRSANYIRKNKPVILRGKDGSIREAIGTLDFGLIPTEHLPKGTADSETSEVSTFAYYDLIAGGWRSFCLDNFIGFVEQVTD